MYSREKYSSKAHGNSTSAPTRNPFAPRPFSIQKQAQKSDSQQENQDFDADYERAKRFEQNLAHIPVNAPGTPPPEPPQSRSSFLQLQARVFNQEIYQPDSHQRQELIPDNLNFVNDHQVQRRLRINQEEGEATNLEPKTISDSTVPETGNKEQELSLVEEKQATNLEPKSDSQQENQDFDADYERAKRFEQNLAHIPVNAPGTPPPEPPQSRSSFLQLQARVFNQEIYQPDSHQRQKLISDNLTFVNDHQVQRRLRINQEEGEATNLEPKIISDSTVPETGNKEQELSLVEEKQATNLEPKTISDSTVPETGNKEQELSLVEEKQATNLEPKTISDSTVPETGNKEQELSLVEEKQATNLEPKTISDSTVPETSPQEKEQSETPLDNSPTKTTEVPSPQPSNTPDLAQYTLAQQNTASIQSEDPGQILEQLKNTPPTQSIASYNQAQTVSAIALEKQKQKVQELIPEIPTPTGLPAQQSTASGKTAQNNAEEAANLKETSAGEIKGETSGQTASQYNTSVAETPPAPSPTATQLAGKETSEEGEQDAALSRSAQNALANVQINTNQISRNVGECPNVDLSGEADPTQIETTQSQSNQEISGAKTQASQAIDQDFGENNIFPEPSNETLKANKELSATSTSEAKVGKSPSIPPEVVGGLDQSLSPFLREKIGVQQEKYKADKDQFDIDSAQAKADSNQEIVNLNEETKQKQLAQQNEAKSEVAQYKQEWQTELDSVEKEYQKKAGKATQEQRKKIGQEKTKGEKEASKHLEEAEKKAEREKQKANQEVAQKKKEGKKESGGFVGWVKSKAKALIDGIKKAVNFIYDNLRKAVKAIFEAAKKLALAAIDLARKAIVGLIKAYGEIIKGLVKIAFAAFPEIAKKINAKIDQAVNKAVQVVNEAADALKKGIAAILDFLANTLDTLLGAFQALYNAILDVVSAVIEAILGVLEKIGYLVSAATQMPDHFWGQMSEEVLGMDVTQPLAFERTKEDCANCNVAPVAEGITPATVEENRDLAALLSKNEFTDNDIIVNQVAPFDIEPELLTSLNLADGGEVEFGESNNPANSIEAIKAELAGEKSPEETIETTETTGNEQEPSTDCCDDEATAQAKLEEMMAQKVEGTESTQKQGEPAKGGEIPANMKTIGPLTPGQRAQYMLHQLKQGVKQWFAANWGKLLVGTIAGITGFIALNILTGGAVMAAVPPLLQILGTVMAGVSMAQIAGHIGDYATKGWAGEIGSAAKSLARAVAVGAIELVFALLFNAGAIFKALKGGIKGAAKAAVTSVKTTVKATAKSVKELGKIGAKGIKTAFKNGKLLLKGVKSGFAKGAKSLDDLAKRLKNKLRFKKFSISRSGKRIQLWGHINPKILLGTTGRIKDIDNPRDPLTGKVTGRLRKGERLIDPETGLEGIIISGREAKKLKYRPTAVKQATYSEKILTGDSRLLAKRLNTPSDEQAHHLIASSVAKDHKAAKLAAQRGWDLNHAKNGLNIPTKPGKLKTPSGQDIWHSGGHTDAYYTAVNKELDLVLALYKKLPQAKKASFDWLQEMNKVSDNISKGILDGSIRLYNK